MKKTEFWQCLCFHFIRNVIRYFLDRGEKEHAQKLKIIFLWFYRCLSSHLRQTIHTDNKGWKSSKILIENSDGKCFSFMENWYESSPVDLCYECLHKLFTLINVMWCVFCVKRLWFCYFSRDYDVFIRRLFASNIVEISEWILKTINLKVFDLKPTDCVDSWEFMRNRTQEIWTLSISTFNSTCFHYSIKNLRILWICFALQIQRCGFAFTHIATFWFSLSKYKKYSIQNADNSRNVSEF